MVNFVSLIAPMLYVTVLIGSLTTFSSLYRKRKAAKAASLEPWFGPHTARDIYLSLLHLDGPKKVPESVLTAALTLRAKEDIKRLMTLRQSKGSIQMLLQKGCVGEDLWTRFTVAEAEMEDELRDIVNEANAYKENWGQVLFQTANEMVNSDRIRDRAEQVTADAAAERLWWDAKRERSSRELFGDSDSEAVVVEKSSGKGKK